MNYSFKKVEQDEGESTFYEVEGGVDYADTLDNLAKMEPYHILDDQGDHIATVFSEVEADALVSHLNR